MGDRRRRVVIRAVAPVVDGGRYPAKRVVGETVVVEADVHADGHDRLAAVVWYRPVGGADWYEAHMAQVEPDVWSGTFVVDEVGPWEFTVQGWVDRFGTWRSDLRKKAAAGVDVAVDLLVGAELVTACADEAAGDDRRVLIEAADRLADATVDVAGRVELALDDRLAELCARHDPRRFATTVEQPLPVQVASPRARFSSWYEVFPRSTALEKGRHGTLRDVEGWLPYVAGMGFDVLYLPPIHPIGRTARKGPNNAPTAGPDDVGSPWAIGAAEGGHVSVHPELGTLDDLDHLVAAAREHGIELALDIAFQCSPDHPWVAEHPEWFRHRPDGSIQYAENPPKAYQDIYPFDFESDDADGLWKALADVIRFWIGHGVRTFRVDNPHTKSLPFWEWCIGEITRDHPDVVFLSEAFTRRAVMYDLARKGFTQSYTYFTWRTQRWELEEYFTELTRPPIIDFFRPNAWPNTPDILPEQLQVGGRPAFVQRLVLAATLCASYGIYGPAFELCEHQPREPGSEEYLDSEKYQLRTWDLDRPDSLKDLIARVNRIRRDNPALQTDRSLRFHHVDNPALIAYSKASDDGRNVVLTVANLDPSWRQVGTVHLDLDALGLDGDTGFQVHDMLGDARYLWHGSANYVELDPHVLPAHVFAIRHLERREHDFDYFM